jgi:ABC-2 type transport system ATP-binding protein
VIAAIETRRLTKRYGSARGIEDLDLTVHTGEVFGFLGPNGAGKSTTIRTLLDLQRPTSGSASVLGFDSRRDSLAVRHRIGYLPGDLRLFDHMTGRDHLDWCTSARGRPATVAPALIERFDIAMERPVRELSKGNRQKIGLLLAFAHRPELLILDEPTSGLDPIVQAEFDALLTETARAGGTVLLSSHSLDEVQRVADRVGIIREGRLVLTDTVDALRARSPRVMTLTFAGTPDANRFRHLPGVEDLVEEDTRLRLRTTGDVGPVLQEAVDQGVVDLTARPADLEELFLGYYRGVVEEGSG